MQTFQRFSGPNGILSKELLFFLKTFSRSKKTIVDGDDTNTYSRLVTLVCYKRRDILDWGERWDINGSPRLEGLSVVERWS